MPNRVQLSRIQRAKVLTHELNTPLVQVIIPLTPRIPFGQDLYLQSAIIGRRLLHPPGVFLDIVPPDNSIPVLELVASIHCAICRILLGLGLTDD